MKENGEIAISTQRTSSVASNVNSEDGPVINTEEFKGKDIKRSDTPQTVLTDFANQPDITVSCDQCNIYLDICNLLHHRAYHAALTTLNYRHPEKPVNVKALLQRRNIILRKKKIEKGIMLHSQDIRKVDEAYELLKNDLEDVYEEMKKINERIDTCVEHLALNCSPECAYAVGICSNKNSRWKSNMEDVKVYQDFFGEDRNKCYLAIFDGYHGITAAEKSGKELHHLLLCELAKFDSKIKSTVARNFADSTIERTAYELTRPETRDSFSVNLHQESTEIVQNVMEVCYKKYDELMREKNEEKRKERKNESVHLLSEEIHKAFKKTYLLMDIFLSYGKGERSKVRWSGTSALTIIIQNIKSSKGSEYNDQDDRITVSSNKEFSMSEKNDQKIKPPEELGLIHIANAGNSRAVLVRDGKPYRLTKDHTPNDPKERRRVVSAGGNLSLSKRDCLVNGVLSVTRGLGNHGDKKLKDCVIVDPHVTTMPIDQYAQFLVLASHGIWEVFSDNEVASLLVKMLQDQHVPPPSQASDSILQLLQRKEYQSSATNSWRQSPSNSLREDQPLLLPQSAQIEKHFFTQEISELHSRTAEFETPADLIGRGTEMMEERVLERNKVSTDKCIKTSNDSETPDMENVLTDLHTELGSWASNASDVTIHSGSNKEQDYFQFSEHSSIELTVNEERQELAKSMAEHLTQAALLAGSKNNITVMVVLLPGCGV